MEERPLLLSVLTPGGEICSVRCASVRFSVPDGKDGKIPGGSVGIRRGHADALMVVAPGKIEGFADGRVILTCRVDGGLAMIGDNRVSVLTNRAETG